MTRSAANNMLCARNYARLIDLLMTSGGSVEEVVECTGFHPDTARRYIKALREIPNARKNVKKLRIIGWSEDALGRLTRPVYKLEPGIDVIRPRMSVAERCSLYRQRKRPPVASVFALRPSHSVGYSE